MPQYLRCIGSLDGTNRPGDVSEARRFVALECRSRATGHLKSGVTVTQNDQ